LNKARESAAQKRLVSARKAYGYSQLEASRLVGLSLQEYREVEKAVRLLTTAQAKSLSERFNINAKQFNELIRQEEIK
jgi:transcriptional regulator with XRE-family HTH domain